MVICSFLKYVIEENECKNQDSFYHSKVILVHILIFLVDHFPGISARKHKKSVCRFLSSPVQKKRSIIISEKYMKCYFSFHLMKFCKKIKWQGKTQVCCNIYCPSSMYSKACDSLLSISVSIPHCIQNSIAFPL